MDSEKGDAMKRDSLVIAVVVSVFGTSLVGPLLFADKPLSLASHEVNSWVKRSPLDNAPVSPRLGYEGACVWDSRHRLLFDMADTIRAEAVNKAPRFGHSIR